MINTNVYYIYGSARVGFRIPVFVEGGRELFDPQKAKEIINHTLQNLSGDIKLAMATRGTNITVEPGVELQNGSKEYFDNLTDKEYVTDENGEIKLERGF